MVGGGAGCGLAGAPTAGIGRLDARGRICWQRSAAARDGPDEAKAAIEKHLGQFLDAYEAPAMDPDVKAELRAFVDRRVADEDDRVSLSPFEIFRREITIKGSFAEIDGFPPAIRALHAGRVRTEGLITHRFGIEEYEEALETLRTDRTAHKIVVHP
jgi:hypothetical protein